MTCVMPSENLMLSLFGHMAWMSAPPFLLNYVCLVPAGYLKRLIRAL